MSKEDPMARFVSGIFTKGAILALGWLVFSGMVFWNEQIQWMLLIFGGIWILLG